MNCSPFFITSKDENQVDWVTHKVMWNSFHFPLKIIYSNGSQTGDHHIPLTQQPLGYFACPLFVLQRKICAAKYKENFHFVPNRRFNLFLTHKDQIEDWQAKNFSFKFLASTSSSSTSSSHQHEMTSHRQVFFSSSRAEVFDRYKSLTRGWWCNWDDSSDSQNKTFVRSFVTIERLSKLTWSFPFVQH